MADMTATQPSADVQMRGNGRGMAHTAHSGSATVARSSEPSARMVAPPVAALRTNSVAVELAAAPGAEKNPPVSVALGR